MRHRIFMRRAMRRAAILCTQSAILIVLVVMLDFALWVFAPVSLAGESDGFERMVTQDLHGLKPTILFKQGKYDLRLLSRFEDVKPNDLIRILCLGASTTLQPTQETQDTWCGMLETRLRGHYRRLNLKIQTMAFGRGGFRASDDAFWIREMFDKIKPDIVITLLGINDLAFNGGKSYRYRDIEETFSKKEIFAKKSHDEELQDRRSPALEGRLTRWCKEYSQLCRRVVQIKRNLKVKEQLKTGAVVEWHSSNLPRLRAAYQKYPYVETLMRDPDPINEFRDAVSWMIRFFGERKVRALMLGQPVLWKESLEPGEYSSLWFAINTPDGRVRPSAAWLAREMARYNSVQQSLASHAAIPYVNLDEKIPKTLDYYFDDCHFTDVGSTSVADNVAPVLTRVIDSILVEKGLRTE